MLLRSLKSKENLFIVFVVLVFIITVAYIFLIHFQENYRNVQWTGERCMSELKSVKYQLNVVTEYKNRIDKLLTDTQKAHDSDKERFKDIMESCVAMKQHSSICQSQFEDLQSECKKVRESFDRVSKELEKFKTTKTN